MAMDVRVNWYDSMGEVVDTVKGLTPATKDALGRQSVDGDKEWAGGTWTECLKYAEYGWQADRELIDGEVEKVLEQVADRLNTHMDNNFREVYDVAGGYVDVARFLDGEPECMVEQFVEEAPKKGKVIKVLTNVAASSFIDEKVIRRRGRAVAIAVEVLYRLGFQMELWAGESVKGYGEVDGKKLQTVEMVKVKEASDPLDWDAVMFSMAHPGMLRRIVFALNEARPTEERKACGFQRSGGYGMPCAFPKDITDQFDVVMEGLKDNHFDMEAFINDIVVTATDDRVEEYA